MTELGEKILTLRKDGNTYNEIVSKLQCSKSTVAYWCNNTTKEKVTEKNEKNKLENPGCFRLMKAINIFKTRTFNKSKSQICKDWNKKFRTSVSHFRRRNNMEILEEYGYKEALEHLGGLKTQCYLTGKDINIESDDFCLDHIVPVSKEGSNELFNMGITTPLANASKTSMELEEYLKLCKDVLLNFGYSVEDPIEEDLH